jgi:hypothetical protein
MTRVAHPELSRRRLDVILDFTERLRELDDRGIAK